ncbi:MAG: lipid-A-disaccharide synthase [Pirellulaceae bacterium]|nr:lipid-A-disaccharide synthase [Pirellulaceae bacterium]
MKIFFSVGEPSGDLHGANLIRELGRRLSGCETLGLGGPRMHRAGCRLLQDMSDLAVMGLFPVLAKLPRFFALLREVERALDAERPDAVVLIDYPGFNWHVARQAKERGIPVFYYGLPQLWAWASWRVSKVRRFVDHALVKLPFEERWFRERGCRATYVGHPYFDQLRGEQYDHPLLDRLAMGPGRLVTILPGSRTHEVHANLPQLLRAAARVRQHVPDVRFAIASYSERQGALARRYVSQANVEAEVYVGSTPELIASAHVCLATSGSVSLELLYHARPSVILYSVPWWTYAALRRFMKVRYITLVNLLTADRIEIDDEHPAPYDSAHPSHRQVLMPEYPTCGDRSADIARHAVEWLTDEPARQRLIGRMERLKGELCRGGASARAADYIAAELAGQRQVRRVA